MEFFDELGSLVASRWKARDYNEEIFPEIASQALAELPPAEHVSFWDVVKSGMTADVLPHQDDIDARFGDPPLTVYTGRKFRIEVLFWTQATPAIHQHSFSGAFHVMHGSSIHSMWNFLATGRIEARLVLGNVSFNRSEILLKGDSRAILAGNSMFHSTYHLALPSISVVVRTLIETNKQPQYTLLPPTIAVAQQDEIAAVKRQTQILRMMLEAGKGVDCNEIVRHLCATKDAYSIFRFLRTVFESIEDEDERQNILLTAKVRHPKLIAALEPALLQLEIGHRIRHLHRTVTKAELKFFLALLRNIPQRTSILTLVEQRYGGRPAVDTVVDWARQLGQLGISTIRLDEISLVLFKQLLMSRTAPEILGVLRERFKHVPHMAELRDLCASLQRAWLFRPLQLDNPFVLDADIAPARGSLDTTATSRQLNHAIAPGPPECATDREGSRLAVAGEYRCVLDSQPDSLVPHTLQRKTPRVAGQKWIINPLLAFSETGSSPDSSIRFAEGVTAAAPTAWVSDPVTTLISPFILGPTLAAIVSTLQPGRQLFALPDAETMELLDAGGLVYEDSSNEQQRCQWRTMLQNAGSKFDSGYVPLGSLLHPFTLSATRSYFRRFVEQGLARHGDRTVPRRWTAHNEPVVRFILHQLTPIMQAVAGVTVKPSYGYFASYYGGAHLARHTDREQCEYSMSMLIDYAPEPDAESPWPLWLETRQESVAIHQRLGDTLIYRGCQLPHYRHQLPPGHTSTHLFLHYVPESFTGELE